jgi:YesN/AraC family two-component response regulator
VDDYLYKPFDVKDVLAALERVKKAATAHQWHRRILAKLMGQVSTEERLEQLSSLREEGLTAFFVAVRSQLLYAETALESWDQWEELDTSYLQVLRNPAPSEIDSLANKIQEWTSRLNQRASAQTFVSAPVRSSQRVERSSFRAFLEKIKSGAISAADLSLAVSLRRLPPERRPADLQELWQTMWGSL